MADGGKLDQRYITQDQFAPVVQKVENLIVEQAVLGAQFKNLSDDVSDMKTSLKNIDLKMTELVNHKAISNWLIKASFWTVSSILVPGGTMIIAHFTGIIKTINKMVS